MGIDTMMPDVVGLTHVGSLAGALRGIRDHLEEINSNIRDKQPENHRRLMRQYRNSPEELEIGDIVLCSDTRPQVGVSHKLLPVQTGPHRVVRRENSQQVTIEELQTGLVVTVHRSRLTKTTLEELSEQERRTILLRPAEARRIRNTNQETYYPSRYGGSGSEISSDSSNSDEPWERANNEDLISDPDSPYLEG